MSGFNSPAASSPSCEIKSEIAFPPLPIQNQQAMQQPLQSHSEQTKVTPKISQLSELEQELSKLHQKPIIQVSQQQTQPPIQQQGVPQQQMHPSYSEAVRQSPTTVQQQFPSQPTFPQQVQSLQQQQQPSASISQTTSTPIASIAQNQTAAPDARKVSRFQVSRVEEQKQQVTQNQVTQTVQSVPQQNASLKANISSPEMETNQQQLQPQQQMQNVVSPIASIQQVTSQAQAFFQQHQGGVVSSKIYLIFVYSFYYFVSMSCSF